MMHGMLIIRKNSAMVCDIGRGLEIRIDIAAMMQSACAISALTVSRMKREK